MTFLSRMPFPFPVGAKQVSVWDRTWAAFDARCAHHVPASLLAHDSTADVARDMDLLRQAVGAKMLNYYGLSSATVVGATAPTPGTRPPTLPPPAWLTPGPA